MMINEQMLRQVTGAVTQGGGGSFLGGLTGAPFNAIGGAVSGFFKGLFPGALIWGGGLAALAHFKPELIGNILQKIDPHTSRQVTGLLEDAKTGGWTKALTIFGVIGAVLSGGFGAISGAFDRVFGGFSGQKAPAAGGNGIGTILGMGAIVASAVAIGALHKNGVLFSGEADSAGAKKPSAIPGENAGSGRTH